MELLKFVRRRSFLSEVAYTTLNIGLAIAVALAVYYTQSVLLGIMLVLVSKWRVLAVRPRFWYANFLSNLVDIIVSISVVFLLQAITQSNLLPNQELALMGVGTLLYIIWLLVIKPRSKRSFVAVQAGTAMLLGSWALFTVTYNWPVSVVVLSMWVIGYMTARHVLSTYDDETYTRSLSLVWGLVLAEIGWVTYHWAIAYQLPFTGGALMLPQVSIIVTLVGFVVYKAYDSFYHYQKIRLSDVILPLLFTVSILLVLLLLFNRVGTAI